MQPILSITLDSQKIHRNALPLRKPLDISSWCSRSISCTTKCKNPHDAASFWDRSIGARLCRVATFETKCPRFWLKCATAVSFEDLRSVLVSHVTGRSKGYGNVSGLILKIPHIPRFISVVLKVNHYYHLYIISIYLYFSNDLGWPSEHEQNTASGNFWRSGNYGGYFGSLASRDALQSHASDRGTGGILGRRLQNILLWTSQGPKGRGEPWFDGQSRGKGTWKLSKRNARFRKEVWH